jgi:hypothetical protein
MENDKAKEMLDNILLKYETRGLFYMQDFNEILEELGSKRIVGEYDNPNNEIAYIRGLMLKRELEEND